MSPGFKALLGREQFNWHHYTNLRQKGFLVCQSTCINCYQIEAQCWSQFKSVFMNFTNPQPEYVQYQHWGTAVPVSAYRRTHIRAMAHLHGNI